MIQINGQVMETIMFLGWSVGVLYKVFQIEASIKNMISKTETSLRLHINDHKLLNHQIKELQHQNRI